MLGASLGDACVPVHLRMRSFIDQLAPSPPGCPGTALALQVTSHPRGCLVGSQTALSPSLSPSWTLFLGLAGCLTAVVGSFIQALFWWQGGDGMQHLVLPSLSFGCQGWECKDLG